VAKRYTPENQYYEPGSYASEDSEGKFVHYSDYDKLVEQVQQAIVEIVNGNNLGAVVKLSDVLMELGEGL
jgi:hypothetical protein